MKIAATHFCARLKATVTEPFALFVLGVACFGSLFYWPGLTGAAGPEGRLAAEFGRTNATWITLLWIYLWSMMAGMVIPGAAAGGRRVEPLATRPLPTLPIGTRTRAFVEALVPLFMVGVVWWLPFCLLNEGPPPFSLNEFGEGDGFRTAFAGHWLMGALTLFPVLLLFLAPAESTHLYMMRPLVPLGLTFVSLKLGCLATPLGLFGTCAVLSAVSLLLVHWRPSLTGVGEPVMPPREMRSRVGRSPESQLLRDLWLRPLPAAAALLALQVLLVVADQFLALPQYGFFLASMLVCSFMLSLVAMRPLGLDLIASALSGKGGYRLGDFGRAWSVLPVRSEAVARGVYLHGIVTGVAFGAVFLGANLFTTWLRTGDPRFIDADRAPGPEFFLPFAAAIPCLAGALTAFAMGGGVRGIVSLASVFAVFVSHVACLIFEVPPAIHGGILIVIASTGGLAPLLYLRTPRG